MSDFLLFVLVCIWLIGTWQCWGGGTYPQCPPQDLPLIQIIRSDLCMAGMCNVFCIYGAMMEELSCFYLHWVPLKTQHRILCSRFFIFAKFYTQIVRLILKLQKKILIKEKMTSCFVKQPQMTTSQDNVYVLFEGPHNAISVMIGLFTWNLTCIIQKDCT